MQITVEMIESKEFKTKVRGYDPAEVDEFLDAICDEIVAMEEEIENLNQRLAQQSANQVRPVKAEPAPAPAPVAAAPVRSAVMDKEQQETLNSLLINAQKVADQTVAEAHTRAEAIVAQAQKKIDEQLAGLEEEKATLAEEVENLKKAAADYKERFLRLMQDQKHVLDAETELFK
ncbi:MAG: DivIVA domain-containing protein [Clostridia bacterium]|nr:DivIVA domain-containing protein [Clostridia bacterium]